MSKRTQKERVITALRHKRGLTPWYAINELGNTRLAATIHSLKKEGYVITSVTETGVNRFGDKIKYSRYFLLSEPKQD
jgi:DNA-binding PadR family transcriptional regulator